jgi:hypothetical protein
MSALAPNADSIRATWRWLAHRAHGVSEVRVIRPARGIVGIGFFDDEESFVCECMLCRATRSARPDSAWVSRTTRRASASSGPSGDSRKIWRRAVPGRPPTAALLLYEPDESPERDAARRPDAGD